jgi:uncharacterized membrane protein YedE/YeeE
MTEFTPLSAAIGGALIGLSVTLLILLAGRVAGITGIFAGTLVGAHGDRGWRVAFLAGLLLAPVSGALTGYSVPAPPMPSNWLLIVAAGLLVGFGTRLGNGCTSGHGICGIARLSTRSIAATVIFMVVAIAVVTVSRHVLGA